MSRAPFTPPTHAARCSRSVVRKSTTPFSAPRRPGHRVRTRGVRRPAPAGRCGAAAAPPRPGVADSEQTADHLSDPLKRPPPILGPAVGGRTTRRYRNSFYAPARQQPNGERAATPARIAAAHLTECAAVLEIGGIAHRNTGVVGLLLEPLVEVLEADRAELDVVDRERPCRPDAADEGDGIADLHPRAGCRDQ